MSMVGEAPPRRLGSQRVEQLEAEKLQREVLLLGCKLLDARKSILKRPVFWLCFVVALVGVLGWVVAVAGEWIDASNYEGKYAEAQFRLMAAHASESAALAVAKDMRQRLDTLLPQVTELQESVGREKARADWAVQDKEKLAHEVEKLYERANRDNKGIVHRDGRIDEISKERDNLARELAEVSRKSTAVQENAMREVQSYEKRLASIRAECVERGIQLRSLPR